MTFNTHHAITGLRGCTIKHPGLKKRTGAWAICVGLLNPVILLDKDCPVLPGYNALVSHEVYHALKRHKLKEVLLFFTFVTVIGVIFYALYKRRIERTADQYAYRLYTNFKKNGDVEDDREYRAFLYLHAAPLSWWGRWKFGATREDRYKRCTGKDM